MAPSGRGRSGRGRSGRGRESHREGRPRPRGLPAPPTDALEPVGGILRDALDEPRFRRGVALGRLVRGWESVVGPRLARETAPRALDDGGLVVAVSTAAWGAQVRFLGEEIRHRANRVLGAAEVRAVRVVVGGTAGGGTGTPDYPP